LGYQKLGLSKAQVVFRNWQELRYRDDQKLTKRQGFFLIVWQVGAVALRALLLQVYATYQVATSWVAILSAKVIG
jgi:hypothetical protein